MCGGCELISVLSQHAIDNQRTMVLASGVISGEMSAPALKPRALGCPSTCAGSTIQQQGAAMRWGASTRGDAKGRSHSARTVSMRIMRAASRPTTAVPRWRAAPSRGLVLTAQQKTARLPTFLCLLMENSTRHCSTPPSGICDDEEHSAQKNPGLA